MKNRTVILITLLLFLSFSLPAQIKDLNRKIPTDPTVKIGKLANGLTYYIKQNAKPKNKAELRLVINAGSILEEDDQQGLAHFVEHMAFNGTKSFEKNELINYLQGLGVEFGADLNAHTGFDETVYKLSVPTDEETFNTSLQVLRDWADGITFEDEEIDNERGIVAEELRARSGAPMRMYYQSIPKITNNSRYAKRLPIGTTDVILNSEYDAMKRFYKDWYRPDLMALVLVGDFDVHKTEKKVKELFSGMQLIDNPKERVYYEIPDNKEPVITVITDKEASGVSISLFSKKDETEVITLNDYRNEVLKYLYSAMLRQRLNEIGLQPDAPFLSAIAGIGDFLGNKDAFLLKASLKEDKITEGIEALLVESERVKRFGFTNTELVRFKEQLLNGADMRRKENGKINTKYYVEQYIDNFTDSKAIPSDAFIYQFYKEVFPTITVEEINNLSNDWIKTDNVAVVLNAIDKENLKLPTEEDIEAILKKVSLQPLEAYEDALSDIKLMTNEPTPGKVISETYNEDVDVTTWKLANGITIIAKPTKFQNDLISMSGFRPGGSSLAPDSLYISARNAGNIIGSSGVNGISESDLNKLNMGKTVRVTPNITFYDDLFSGSSSSKDLETMLQMVHLYITSPNKDEGVFNSKKANLKSIYKDQDKSPGNFFDNQISEIMTKGHLRGVPLTVQQIEDGLNIDDAFKFYKERLASANGFTFVFVGSIDLKNLRAFTAKYLGSLPSDLEKESTWKDIGMRYTNTVVKKTFLKGVENKSIVDMRFTNNFDFSLKEKNKLSLLGKLLKIKLTEEMREKMSGVYGVQVAGYASDIPYGWYRMNIRFTCDPNNVEKLVHKVLEEIKKIQKDGATEADLYKIKEAELANHKEFLEINAYWINKLREAVKYDLKLESILDSEAEINNIDSNMFKDAANTYFNMNNYAEFVLKPEASQQE
ncbi:insulinase family protein [Winogradskyella sp. F6397]|uniref:Insulinase family protein n=1 Tax=Winogradskyella marina TaxID=2785530 RepID=A0ABS0ECS8_9FLAO|nr:MULTISPECIES: M16 family metallopeptidase [Winogradskyella]MBF8148266.1 insulinase family protein [Winogradskyella marina]